MIGIEKSMHPKIVAIVPMRQISERVAGKNYRLFAGEPLYRRILSTLLSCKEIHAVVIDTDSDAIAEDTSKAFPSAMLYRRPNHLCGGMTPMNDVLLNTVQQIDADFYLQTHSTNPLLSSKSLSGAIKAFSTQPLKYDSLFSVTRLQTRLWNPNTEPLNHDPLNLQRTQDLEPLFEENSCMYLFSRHSLEKFGSRIGTRPLMFEIDKLEALDIDDEQDFILAEALYIQSQT
jgi:CMP-N-acetylneuraminic acid synthetase